MAGLITAPLLMALSASINNTDMDELVEAGVLMKTEDGKPVEGGTDWRRFNDDFQMFIVKAPYERVVALAKLLNAKVVKFSALFNTPKGSNETDTQNTADKSRAGFVDDLLRQWLLLGTDMDGHQLEQLLAKHEIVREEPYSRKVHGAITFDLKNDGAALYGVEGEPFYVIAGHMLK